MKWERRTVLITGASRGIGAATAEALATRGYPLALTFRSEEEAARVVAARCLALGAPQAVVCRLDLLDDEAIREFAAVADEFSVLVNNAGVIDWTPFGEMDSRRIGELLRINVEGPLKLTCAILRKVRDCVLMVGSDVVATPHPDLVVYGASKAALVSAARALAKGVAEPQILIVHPDRTATRMNEFEGRSPVEVATVIAEVIGRRVELPTGSEIQVGTWARV